MGWRTGWAILLFAFSGVAQADLSPAELATLIDTSVYDEAVALGPRK